MTGPTSGGWLGDSPVLTECEGSSVVGRGSKTPSQPGAAFAPSFAPKASRRPAEIRADRLKSGSLLPMPRCEVKERAVPTTDGAPPAPTRSLSHPNSRPEKSTPGGAVSPLPSSPRSEGGQVGATHFAARLGGSRLGRDLERAGLSPTQRISGQNDRPTMDSPQTPWPGGGRFRATRTEKRAPLTVEWF